MSDIGVLDGAANRCRRCADIEQMPENAVSPARPNAPALMNASSPLSTTPYELLVQAVMDYVQVSPQ
jgi:hypothetical protein